MNKIITAVVLSLSLLSLASCKTVTLGKETEVYRKDQSLTSETVALRIENLTSQGNGVNSIEIIDADYIDVEVQTNTELKDHGFTLSINDDTILISSNQDKPFKNLILDIIIYAPIDRIDVEGNFELNYDRPQVPTIDLHLRGAGDVSITGIQTEMLDVELEGAGAIYLTGSSTSFKALVDGAGSIDAANLEAIDARAIIEGMGSIDLFAKEDLYAEISGLGNITYAGNPQLTRVLNGLGTIRKTD